MLDVWPTPTAFFNNRLRVKRMERATKNRAQLTTGKPEHK